jgi:hypothetical protein
MNDLDTSLDELASAYRAYCKAVENVGKNLAENEIVRNHPERRGWENSIGLLSPSWGEWDRGFRKVRSQVEKAQK